MNVRGKPFVFTWTSAALLGVAGIVAPIQSPAQPGNGVPFQNLQRQIDELRNQLDGLTGNSHGTETAITVDCGAGEKIGDAINGSRPGGTVRITVKGTCSENVVISRSRLILQGDPGGGGVNAAVSNRAAIAVPATIAVTIRNLTVAAEGDGISATRNADVTVDNVVVSSTGIPGSGGSTGFAVIVTDGASARVSNSNVSSTATHVIDGGAVGIFRSGVLRMAGGNTATSTAGGRVVHLAHTANLRQDAPDTYVGPIGIFNLSFADFRGAALTSDMVAGGSSWYRFRNTAVNGTLHLHTDSGVIFNNGVFVSGAINCDGEIFGAPPLDGAVAFDCK